MMTPADAAISRFLGLIAASRKPIPRALAGFIESTDAIQRGSTASSPSAGRVRHCRTPKNNNDAPRISLTTPEADGPADTQRKDPPMTARIASIPFLHRAAARRRNDDVRRTGSPVDHLGAD